VVISFPSFYFSSRYEFAKRMPAICIGYFRSAIDGIDYKHFVSAGKVNDIAWSIDTMAKNPHLPLNAHPAIFTYRSIVFCHV